MWKSKLVVLIKCALYITLCTSISWLLFTTAPSTLVDSSYPPTLYCKHILEDCTIKNFTCPATPPHEWKYPRVGWQSFSYSFVFSAAYFVYYIILHDWGFLIGKRREMMAFENIFVQVQWYEEIKKTVTGRKSCSARFASFLFRIFITLPVKLFIIFYMIFRFLLFGFPSPFKLSYFHAMFSLGMLLIYAFGLCVSFFVISITQKVYFYDESTQTPDCLCNCQYHLQRSPCLQILMLTLVMLIKGSLVMVDLIMNGRKCLISVSYLVPFTVASHVREEEPALEIVKHLEREFKLVG